MENSKNEVLSRGRVLSALCLIVFIMLFIFACMFNSVEFGAKLVGTFGVVIYPTLIVLSLICFAKFMGLSYTRSVKASVYIVCFLISLCLVIHSIRTFSVLDTVSSRESFKNYIELPYTKLTVFGSVGSLLAGAIAYLIGGMGSIVVYVILATLFIGLFLDYELYGKHDSKQLAKLRSKKLREKVMRSDENMTEDGKPDYSFTDNNEKTYSQNDVAAEITASYGDVNGTGKREEPPVYTNGDVVGEIVDDQIYDSNQSYYGGDDGYPYSTEMDYPVGNGYASDYNSNTASYADGYNGNYQAQDSSGWNSPFGKDAVQQGSEPFNKNFYSEKKYPDVYDEYEERRKFLADTFNLDGTTAPETPSVEIRGDSNLFSGSSDNLSSAFSGSNGGGSSGYSGGSSGFGNEIGGYKSAASSASSGFASGMSGTSPYFAAGNSADAFGNTKSSSQSEADDEDSGRISKNDLEWKFKDEDFNYFDYDSFKDKPQDDAQKFSSSSVDDKISQILNGNDKVESSVQNDIKDNFTFGDNDYRSVGGFESSTADVVGSGDLPDLYSSTGENVVPSISDYNNDSAFGGNSSFDNSGSGDNFGSDSSAPVSDDNNFDAPVKVPAKEAEKKINSSIKMGFAPINYVAPTIDIFNPVVSTVDESIYDAENEERAKRLEEALAAFNIPVTVTNIIRGPKITRYELSVPLGVSIKKIPNYELDIKKHLFAKTIRIEAPIPGTEYVGVELENKTFSNVSQRELFESDEFKNFQGPLPIAIGKDISGKVIVESLTKMIHLLIAGSTGSGKSVFLHSIIMSLLYKNSPSDLRIMIVDPKKVEFLRYNGMPHLLTPESITDVNQGLVVLKWACDEMDRRYELISKSGYRGIGPYNNSELVKSGQMEKLPYIVLIIDEFAEVIAVNRKESEFYIQRIAELSRACGMHLILATQRPSVDIISGVIKNNIPTRIAFKVLAAVDSKTIIETIGAEDLLGNGDMIYKPNSSAVTHRLQGAYCTDEEIDRMVQFNIKNNPADYDESVLNILKEPEEISVSDSGDNYGNRPQKGLDSYIKDAIKIFVRNGVASASSLQRKLQIGYARSARIMDQLEEMGYVSPANGSKIRKITITPEQYKQQFGEELDINPTDNSGEI